MKKINWKFWRRLVYWLVIAVLAVIAGITAISVLEIPNGIRLYTVQSGSMAPSIRAGSIVMIRPFDKYQKGDVITFKAERDRLIKSPKYTTTHRVDEVKKDKDDEVEYITKGDANKTPDSESVKKDLVLGKAILAVPLLGFPVSFAKTQVGLIVLIVIPATLIIYSEALNIKKEVVRIAQSKKKKNEEKTN